MGGRRGRGSGKLGEGQLPIPASGAPAKTNVIILKLKDTSEELPTAGIKLKSHNKGGTRLFLGGGSSAWGFSFISHLLLFSRGLTRVSAWSFLCYPLSAEPDPSSPLPTN